ncbi:hypothetical protein BU23DRAFT_495665 [Bimuria novae-zelandiae CBS 107.79]|uniref:Apple domain-containing protein n=1 Tax=Bimuria novae-zelandiae CBS 107.79 TaxID=1447943 RepID=A0A6A5VTP7_9PLEO|nr:hypothetical protein BU23DRAFT_495665 [Bimuria novae-zelandiae CBS 107.79]
MQRATVLQFAASFEHIPCPLGYVNALPLLSTQELHRTVIAAWSGLSMMNFSKSANLLALIWASRTLATPLLVESLFGRADTSTCVKSFTSGNGLNFTNIQCNQNNPFNDALAPITIDSMGACMERCSRFWGGEEGCFGIVFRSSDSQCWMRNSTTSQLSNNRTIYTKTLTPEDGIHSALVDLNQMKPLNTDCPAPDKSRHSLDGYEGIQYTIQCNKDIGGGYDTQWSYPYNDNPFQAFYHATSLEDCLQNCMKEHPLCRGVIYNPGLEIGYANCWPKTGFPLNIPTTQTRLKVVHSATIDQIETPNTECNKNETYTSTSDDSKNFAVHCGQTNQGTNMTTVHAQNFTSCMEECASNDNGCVGVVYDSTLTQGYENCYLQNTSSIFTDIGSSMYAVMSVAKPKTSGAPESGNGGTSTNNNDDSSESKAWIAGAVIGPLAGLALIGAAIWFFRRRKHAGAVLVADVQEADSITTMNPYSQHSHGSPVPVYAPVPQHSPGTAPSELGGQNHQMVEMEAGSAAKYARKNGAAPGHQVHELG